MARPKFVPTEEQRRTVKSMSAYGIKQEGIARVLRIRSLKTLRKHFRDELDLGDIEGVAQAAQTHYKMATSGKHPASTIHFLEKRRRWLESPNSEAKPAETPQFVVVVEKKAA
jgi:hypothetical protein